MIALNELRRVDRADVYKGATHAGELRRRDDGAVEFAYSPDYLADRSTPPVAWTLPKHAEPVISGAGALPPFFAGLLPEGVRLTALYSATRTSADDHLTLLLGVGGDAIGDVAVSPADAPLPAAAEPLDEAAIASMSLREIFARATSTDPALFERVALPGVQPKVSAAMVSTPLKTSRGPAILKLNPPRDFPHLVRNEAFFLAMAQACGLPVPSHRLVADVDGDEGLLIARFDRDERGGRLPQEDACQLMGRYPADKYRIRAQDAILIAAKVISQKGGSAQFALLRLLALTAFSYLIGNGDLHGKNISVRQAPTGVWEVTPAYDLVSTQPYLGWDDPMALDLYGRANRLDRTHLLQSAERLGLPERALTRSLDRLCDAAEPWLDRLQEIGFDERTTQRLRELISVRLRELRAPVR